MKLKLKNTPEQVELIKALGSKDLLVSREASEAFAAFIGPVISKVLAEAGTSGMIYSDSLFDEDDSPSYPLDLYYNQDAGFVSVWSQGLAGGLPTSDAGVPIAEMKIATYRLDSAVSLSKKYARKARLDVVSKALERMAQEVLIKQERNAWAVIVKALVEAATKNGRSVAAGSSGSLRHAMSVTTPGTLSLADFNSLLVRVKRINVGFAGGTPAETNGATDVFLSPELMGSIRNFSASAVGSGTDLPAGVREEIFRGAGLATVYGLKLHELIELGLSQRYNTLFETFSDSTNVDFLNPAGLSGKDFNTADDQVMIALDLGREAFVRPVARQADSGGTFSALPDDQFFATRSDKMGFYGFLEEGRACLDGRAVAGLIV